MHQTLRVTPAMEAGVTNHVWSVAEIVALLTNQPTKRPAAAVSSAMETLMGWLNKTLGRSPQEVVEILTKFSIGEPTGFLADDFIHIPITDPVLDQIRETFEKLADDHLDWEPQMPFPEAGAKALQLLIERASALV